MILRKLALTGASVLLAAVATAATTTGAGADGPTDLVFKPFRAEGTIFNDSPPNRINGVDYRIYIDGDNFSIKPVTHATPNASRLIDSNGVLGIQVSPTTEYYVDGTATDFTGAIVEGCTTEVDGFVVPRPTQVARDELRATVVTTTCLA